LQPQRSIETLYRELFVEPFVFASDDADSI
jgi:hypothetical protein